MRASKHVSDAFTDKMGGVLSPRTRIPPGCKLWVRSVHAGTELKPWFSVWTGSALNPHSHLSSWALKWHLFHDVCVWSPWVTRCDVCYIGKLYSAVSACWNWILLVSRTFLSQTWACLLQMSSKTPCPGMGKGHSGSVIRRGDKRSKLIMAGRQDSANQSYYHLYQTMTRACSMKEDKGRKSQVERRLYSA